MSPSIPQRSAPGDAPTAVAGSWKERWWPWLAGTVLGLVVLGPALRPGSLLSLDLLVTPRIPVPNGLYGLGPALSQRVPSFAVLGMASWAVGGPFATKAAIVAMVAAAFVGAGRLTGPKASALTRVAAGILWAAGPFSVTRIGVGHLNVVWALAVLPWALPRLCRPSASLWSTFLAAGLLAFGGPGSGTLGVAVAGIALFVEAGRRRPVRVVLAVGIANLVWIAPTAVLLWAGASVNGAGGFATNPNGAAGWPGVLVGGGFWRADEQVGATGWWGAVAGLLILALALVGRRRLDRTWARPAIVVAVSGLALALATALPGVRDAYGWLSDLPIGAPLRESHRFLALWLVLAIPAAALGGEELAARLARTGSFAPTTPSDPAAGRLVGRAADALDPADRGGPSAEGEDEAPVEASGSTERLVPAGRRQASAAVVAALPLALGVLLSLPGWWGIGGRLEPVRFPADWAAAKAQIDARPGTVVAFPWSEYPPISFANGRQAFNPVPDYLGGDVISSYDPGFHPDVASQEQVDHRADLVDAISRDVRAGRAGTDRPTARQAGARLAALGVRWVIVVHERNWERYAPLTTDPGLERVLDRPDVDLYRVRGWAGRATRPDGRPARLDRPVPPLLTTDAPKGSVLQVAGAPGWIQGWHTPVAVTPDGRLRLTGDGGIVWFWPAPALVALDLALLAATGVAISSTRGRRSR